MSAFSAEELSAFELAVTTAAQRHEQISVRSDGKYTRLFHLGDFSVKYTDHVFIKQECEMLRCLYDLTITSGATAPRVPRVVHYFHGSLNYWGYMIMERISLRTVSADELCHKAAEAVLWLRAQRMDFFGSRGGANPWHTVFQGNKAPEPFTSVAAAQRYLNVAVGRVRRPSWMPPIAQLSLVDDDVVLTQSDMNAGNFGVALDGRAVVFDAATIQALPKTLADFTLLRTTNFAKAVSTYVFDARERDALPASSNFEALAEVRNRLSRSSNDGLGVDANGNLKITDTSRPALKSTV